MKRLFGIILLLSISFQSFAQEIYLEAVNIKTGKVIKFPDQKRVRIKTIDGEK